MIELVEIHCKHIGMNVSFGSQSVWNLKEWNYNECQMMDGFCASFGSDISSSGTNDLSGKDKTTAYMIRFVVSDITNR